MTRAAHQLTRQQALDLIRLCENMLGWIPQPRRGKAPSVIRKEAARKLQDKAAEDERCTPQNLRAAVHYLHQQQKPLFQPWAITFYVDKIVETSVVEAPTTDRVDIAVAKERELEHPGWDYWTRRLVRATGPVRAEVLDEWQLERGHLWA